MEKRKFKRLLAIGLVLMLLICSIPTVFAGTASTRSVNDYTATFPARQRETPITTGIKVSPNSKQASHRIDTAQIYGVFHIVDTLTGTRITIDLKCDTGINVMPYTSNMTGTVTLYGRNALSSIDTVPFAGEINFS